MATIVQSACLTFYVDPLARLRSRAQSQNEPHCCQVSQSKLQPPFYMSSGRDGLQGSRYEGTDCLSQVAAVPTSDHHDEEATLPKKPCPSDVTAVSLGLG